ncbi:MAG: hypothetical protein HQL87_00735 [Magnetococcales bacterium]|nr:hypothetical protein [Magnetococcales bacterium]
MERQKTASCFPDTSQQGNAVVTVMITMFMITLLVSALVEHFLVTEAKAVEESLAKVRIYWAMSGHVDYFYSKVAVGCNASPSIPPSNPQSLLDELDTVSGTHKKTWGSYDGIPGYTFEIQHELLTGVSGCAIPIRLTPVNNPASPVDVLNGLGGRLLPLNVLSTLAGTTLSITQYERYRTTTP